MRKEQTTNDSTLFLIPLSSTEREDEIESNSYKIRRGPERMKEQMRCDVQDAIS